MYVNMRMCKYILYTNSIEYMSVSMMYESTPILKSLHWLPVQYRINCKLCCITHLALSLKEPHYLNSLLINRLNSHSLRSSSFNPLTLPFINKKSNGCRSFAHAAPFLWNHLPNTVRSAPTYLSFRKSLKTYLFNQAFPT